MDYSAERCHRIGELNGPLYHYNSEYVKATTIILTVCIKTPGGVSLEVVLGDYSAFCCNCSVKCSDSM